MQLKRIKIDHWYQTTDGGTGQCLVIGAREVKLQIDGKAVWLSPSDVRFEIANGQEPYVEEDRDRPEAVEKKGVLEAWEDHQALKAVAAALLAGLRLAVHHLENPGIPIAPDSLKNLHAAIGKAEPR